MEAAQSAIGGGVFRSIQNCVKSQASVSGRPPLCSSLSYHAGSKQAPCLKQDASRKGFEHQPDALFQPMTPTRLVRVEALGVNSAEETSLALSNIASTLLDSGQVTELDESAAEIFRPTGNPVSRLEMDLKKAAEGKQLIISGRKPIDPTLPPLPRGQKQLKGPVRRPIESSKARKERIRQAWGVGKKIDDSRNSAHTQRLLEEVTEAKSRAAVVAALEYWSKCYGVARHDLTYLISMLRQKRHWGRTVQVIEWMLQSAQFPASDNEHNLLIDAYSKSGNVQKAMDAFDARPSLGFKLHVRSVNILLNCFCQHGMVPQAEELWERLVRMDLEPDMVTYNTMLDLYCRQRLVEKAEAHMATIRYKAQPTVITYTSLIGMYSSIGDQKGAEDLLQEAEESGNLMDATIYTTLLTAYARLGLVPEAQKMMDKMESRGLQLDLLAYNGLLNAYVKAGEFTRADILLFTEMKRKKIRPNRASYHTLLSGYAKAGLYREAEQVLTHMEMAGIKAELYTYTILIQAYANSKQPGRAMSIYARMKDNNIEPDQAVFQMMLDAFSKAGLVEFAERVVHAMRSHGYEANAYTMVELIHLYCRARDVPRAEIAFQAMRSKGLLKGPFISDAYNGLINAYAKMGMAAKAMDAFRELLRHAERFGGRINNSVCASLKFAIMDRPEFDTEADELIKLAKKWNLRAETQGPGHRDGRDGFNMRAPKLPRARQTVFGVAARSPPHVYRNRDSIEEERRQLL